MLVKTYLLVKKKHKAGAETSKGPIFATMGCNPLLSIKIQQKEKLTKMKQQQQTCLLDTVSRPSSVLRDPKNQKAELMLRSTLLSLRKDSCLSFNLQPFTVWVCGAFLLYKEGKQVIYRFNNIPQNAVELASIPSSY